MTIFGDCTIKNPLDFISCTLGLTNVGDGNIGAVLLLFAGMFGLFGVSKQIYGFDRAWFGAALAGTVASGAMAKLGWVSSNVVYLCIALLVVGIFFLVRATEEQQ